MRRLARLLAVWSVFGLGGCASPPTPEDWNAARAAPKPTSEDSAQKAVVTYFAGVLKDPDSAKYRFMPVVNGIARMGSLTMKGWFMCGTINAKNSFGGYTGAEPFLAYFEPSTTDQISQGTVDADQYNIIGNICSGLYGRSTL